MVVGIHADCGFGSGGRGVEWAGCARPAEMRLPLALRRRSNVCLIGGAPLTDLQRQPGRARPGVCQEVRRGESEAMRCRNRASGTNV